MGGLDSYFYLRSTPEDRIIIGGEDEELTDPAARDALTKSKVPTLLGKLEKLIPGARREVETAWTGFFGETEDGLPLIGQVPGHPRCYAAFGYGGNGITFSALAADLLAGLLDGRRDPSSTSSPSTAGERGVSRERATFAASIIERLTRTAAPRNSFVC